MGCSSSKTIVRSPTQAVHSPHLVPPTIVSTATITAAGPAVEPIEIHVMVTRDDDATLGIKLESDTSGILIAEMEEQGVLQEWNNRHPSRQVRSGDVIVAVNGIRNSIFELSQELRKTGPLDLVVKRQPHGMVSAASPQAHWSHVLMQYRSLGPEDFEQLLALDEKVPSRETLSLRHASCLPCKSAWACATTECRVCLESLLPEATVMQLPCGHAFHPDCIVRWLTQHKRRCPLCAWPVAVPAPDESGDTGIDSGFPMPRRSLLSEAPSQCCQGNNKGIGAPRGHTFVSGSTEGSAAGSSVEGA
eukprot:CAMPEP_0180475184 /NCGR_PEP_ID=MMETSP1036_2-20121128/31066_1 /TAXON_ID=632150 /ORGANISM="Azadinium spinosum, Strain 3D9" /LENGTH=303 /DNA_ID=CAMNT_0022482533 /DNA_START=8 /DNA_END=919 /DNA_ORIENTATION=+